MRAADVVGSDVVNVLVVDSLPTPPEWKDWGLYQGELIECGPDIGPGATYDAETGEFTPAPPPDPEAIE